MIDVTFWFKLESTKAKVKVLPRENEEIILDGVSYKVTIVQHQISQGVHDILIFIIRHS